MCIEFSAQPIGRGALARSGFFGRRAPGPRGGTCSAGQVPSSQHRPRRHVLIGMEHRRILDADRFTAPTSGSTLSWLPCRAAVSISFSKHLI
jgi:hypothetical protein